MVVVLFHHDMMVNIIGVLLLRISSHPKGNPKGVRPANHMRVGVAADRQESEPVVCKYKGLLPFRNGSPGHVTRGPLPCLAWYEAIVKWHWQTDTVHDWTVFLSVHS